MRFTLVLGSYADTGQMDDREIAAALRAMSQALERNADYNRTEWGAITEWYSWDGTPGRRVHIRKIKDEAIARDEAARGEGA